ncbi:uncharacterized protein [Diabrotica undecimpunctata]|uniref:uncharacterized protein n=1 Tax=Diabrotica undecimpunctata TaxID=50387 RepID=UPI003B63B7C2
MIYTKYFYLVKEITLNIPPESIYNLDETSFCLDPSGNTTEEKLPPLIILKGKNLWDTWLAKKDDEYPGITYGATINGWMKTETFSNYIEHTFLPNIPKDRPVVLIYDGHSSHTSIALIETALREDINILKLLPHTSHLLQPMDLAVFKPLKQMYDEARIKWQRRNYGTKLPKSIFSSIISQVLKELSLNHI